jgi:2-polyprenyl-6-methoxyphenol hydroxylase-like FAD-dependent oxidoreductase
MLERIGVSKRLAGLGIQARQFSIRDGDRELVPVRFDQLPTKYPDTLMVPQNITEQVLLARLEELGGKVHRPYVATGVSQTADLAEVRLDSGDMIKAQYVVAADGMNSTIRDVAGLGHDGNDALPLSFALADVRVEGDLPADQVLLFSPHPACWWWRRSRTARSGSSPKSTTRRSSRTSPTRSDCSTREGRGARR